MANERILRFFFPVGALWILAVVVHQEAPWSAQDPLWFCGTVCVLPDGDHACVREGEGINLSTHEQGSEIPVG